MAKLFPEITKITQRLGLHSQILFTMHLRCAAVNLTVRELNIMSIFCLGKRNTFGLISTLDKILDMMVCNPQNYMFVC